MTSPPPTVWITRAEPGAAATARRVAAAGFTPCVLPLLETVDLPGAAGDLARAAPAALAFTSANGVRAFARLNPRRDLTAWCVGPATADAARAAGFRDVIAGRGDVAALARDILSAPAAGEILHAAAEAPAGDLVGALVAAGRPARRITVYATRPTRPDPADLARALRSDVVLVHSPRAGRILAGRLAEAAGPGPRVLGLSAACLAPLADLDLAGRSAPESPLEPDLINLLASCR